MVPPRPRTCGVGPPFPVPASTALPLPRWCSPPSRWPAGARVLRGQSGCPHSHPWLPVTPLLGRVPQPLARASDDRPAMGQQDRRTPAAGNARTPLTPTPKTRGPTAQGGPLKEYNIVEEQYQSQSTLPSTRPGFWITLYPVEISIIADDAETETSNSPPSIHHNEQAQPPSACFWHTHTKSVNS